MGVLGEQGGDVKGTDREEKKETRKRVGATISGMGKIMEGAVNGNCPARESGW